MKPQFFLIYKTLTLQHGTIRGSCLYDYYYQLVSLEGDLTGDQVPCEPQILLK